MWNQIAYQLHLCGGTPLLDDCSSVYNKGGMSIGYDLNVSWEDCMMHYFITVVTQN